MIRRVPSGRGSSLIQKLLGGVILAEALAFGGTYLVWWKLNTDRQFRRKASEKYPWALEYYYWIGEKVNKDCPTRAQDQLIWTNEKALEARRQNPGQ